MTSSKTILVTTANGTVGSVLAHLLLDQGFKVNALVRNVESDVARELAKRGANVIKGDFDDIESLKKASEGIWGVFINGLPTFGTTKELEQNKNVINAAREAGAKFGIYNSAFMAERKDEFPNYGPEMQGYWYWESKYGTEKALKEAGFDYWTILRPGMFIASYFNQTGKYMWPAFQKERVLITSLDPSTTFSFTDTDYIGRFAAAAFADPERYTGLEVDVASEDITIAEYADKITETLGIKVEAIFLSKEEAAARGVPNRLNDWDGWRKSIGYELDYKRLDKFPVDRGTVSAYLQKNKKSFTEFLTQE
jgi:uncharacterized protein YbjT (DUF2867 family)